MAITVYSGVPGSGKSYAVVSQVIVPAMLAGRMIRTNVDGLDVEKLVDYCKVHPDLKGPIGQCIKFHGYDAQKPGFWPTEETGDADTVVKGGDLIVLDEFKLYFANTGKIVPDTMEPFMRYHRHFTSERGQTCDVVIATQLITDIHRSWRGCVEGSFKFRKLKSLGAKGTFQWDFYEGHTQPKGGRTSNGNGRYKNEISALYSSYSGGVAGIESNTDARQTIWSKGLLTLIGFGVVAFVVAIYGMYTFLFPEEYQQPEPDLVAADLPGNNLPRSQQQNVPAPSSRYRIVGQLVGDLGVQVVLADRDGGTMVLPSSDFEFRDGRPVTGEIDGQTVRAIDRFKVSDDVKEIGQ